MYPTEKHVLVTVAGADAPGITATLAGIIANAGAQLRDIEQVVVQGQLTLCLAIGVEPGQGLAETVQRGRRRGRAHGSFLGMFMFCSNGFPIRPVMSSTPNFLSGRMA